MRRVARGLLGFVALLLAGAAGAQTALPAATAYAVVVTWDAPSTSPDPVAGYNIYEAAVGSGSYVLTGTVTASFTAYTDEAAYVVQGAALDYIVESVDAEGNLSVPSNMATVEIPLIPAPSITVTTQ